MQFAADEITEEPFETAYRARIEQQERINSYFKDFVVEIKQE